MGREAAGALLTSLAVSPDACPFTGVGAVEGPLWPETLQGPGCIILRHEHKDVVSHWLLRGLRTKDETPVGWR